MNLLSIITLAITVATFILVIISLNKKKDDRDLEILLKQNNETRKELMQMLDNERVSISSQLAQFDSHMNSALSNVENKNEGLSKQVYVQLEKIREDNDRRLDIMRNTVDEKLTVTLNTRLNESFKIVSDQLESVHTSLGEMKSLSTGVGDLNRLLGNIKTRGVWGELQAENILSEILVPAQWEKNIITRKGSNCRVEYAIKLPGKKGDVVYLPIDAKFPKEDYERIQKFTEENNKEGIDSSIKALSVRIIDEAKSISSKYIDPPNTTDFAILFLPLEGLYAEVLNIPGLFDLLISKYKVVISGPTTFSALINSLQLGFKTLTLEKRSEEVWNVLSAVKTEFERFGSQVEKVQQRLNQATNSIENLGTRTRVMSRKLHDVESLQEDKKEAPSLKNDDAITMVENELESGD
jgi:DNA recombination protein RmuC